VKDRLTRLLLVAAAVVVGASALATFAWIVATVGVRPLDGVEGEVLFESDRIRAHLPLYVDPAIGAREYGAVPARYYVLYPPVWSWLLSFVPRSTSLGIDGAALIGRLVATFCFLLPFASIARRALREGRRDVLVAAASGGGMWTLALFGASARPDAAAIACSGIALVRAARRKELDVLCGVLLALAAWLKPNVVGIAPGAFLGCAIALGPRSILRPLAGALGAGSAIGVILTAAASRAWLDHLLLSTGQAPSLSLWIEQMAARGPFFVLPFIAALVLGWRNRRDAGAAIATAALATSTGWAFLSIAKIGSASNYFIEPTVAAVVVLASVPAPRPTFAVAAFVLAQVSWNGVATIRSATERIGADRARGAMLAESRSRCGASEKDLVIADEPGIERMLDGRIVQTPFQSTHLSARGAFPLDAWRADLAAREVRCLLMQNDLLERATRSREHDRFPPQIVEMLRASFEPVEERAGYRLYRRRL
jgi:hypothetical protein